MKTNHQIPNVNNDKGSGPSKIVIANSTSHGSGGTPPPVQKTVTWLHRTARSTFTVATVEFEGAQTFYVAVNADANSINFTQYAVYIPSGSYGVQLSASGGDIRPSCAANNGILNPFVVNGQTDQVADFAC